MKFTINNSRSFHQIKTDALVVGVFSKGDQVIATSTIDHASNNYIKKLLKNEFEAKVGSTMVLRELEGTSSPRIILVGLGPKDHYNVKHLIKAHRNLFSVCKSLSLKKVCNTLLEIPIANCSALERARIAARTLENASYQYTATLSKAPDPIKLDTIEFTTEKEDKQDIQTGLEQGRAIGLGMKLTRELGNLPGNICTPTYLGEQAKNLAKEYKQIKADVLERKQIEALKMNSFLSVAAGSDQPPRFIVMRYQAGSKPSKEAPVVFVGKGVTFDSGGISLKPGAGMDEMKFDMCGAATVFGLFKFLAESGYSKDVIGIVAATENMPNGSATKPGDVITSMSGRTIEVLNTDAEGRLILCDALTYAERFNPAAVINMCTLTGACVIALGAVNTGLFGNNEALVSELKSAGDQAYDKAWPMPMDEEYHEQLKSNYADVANIGGRPAGAITAACFLSKFTENYDWAHLDIAATAWDKNGPDKGAIGRPVPLLAQYLLNRQ